MKKFLLFIVMSTIVSNVAAQELIIKNMSTISGDLTASVSSRKDTNGQACALIRVLLAEQGAQFEGNIIGSVEQKTGEYMVYVPQDTKALTVKLAGYKPLTVNFSQLGVSRIESKVTYTLILAISVKADNQTQQFSITVSPKDAIVLIDSKPYTVRDGVVKAILPVGKHQYIVTANGYEPYNGSVTLKAEYPTVTNIELNTSASASVKESEAIDILAAKLYSESEDYLAGTNGKSKDIQKAIQLLSKSADMGFSLAQAELGLCYLTGEGVTKNTQKGAALLKKAADQGFPSAMFNLANCYNQGIGVPQSDSMAHQWYLKAAENGNVDAQYNVGRHFLVGEGCRIDYSKAKYWFEKAAAQGDEESNEFLKDKRLRGVK
jgi:hypothetical protein